jgi:hypothetical protein
MKGWGCLSPAKKREAWSRKEGIWWNDTYMNNNEYMKEKMHFKKSK